MGSESNPISIRLCPRCHLRHLSIPSSSDLYLQSPDVLISRLTTEFCIDLDRILTCNSTDLCPTCLGLLQPDYITYMISLDTLQSLCSVYTTPTSYTLGLSIPSLALFHDLCLSAHDQQEQEQDRIIISVKDVLRAVLVPGLVPILPGAVSVPQSPFQIDLNLNSCWPDADLDLGQKLAPYISRTLPKNLGVKQLRRTSLTSAKFVEKAVSVMTQHELHAVSLRFRPAAAAAVPAQIQVHRQPIYLLGSYSKFCRRLSQTPWLIGDDLDGGGERRMDGSVQDLIAQPIIYRFGTQRQYTFHSAGREDIDVRMLGDGREFILEITDPHHMPPMDLIHELQHDINQSTDRIQVHSLSLTCDASAQFKALEDGARTKTKSYRAIVWLSSPITDLQCESVSSTKPFNIQQLTPIRVLHRRALLSRPRTIHRLMLTRINSHFAILDLETQAGTYIKEFVHGDRGRTQPNLGSMLNCQADILQLDVLDLHHHNHS